MLQLLHPDSRLQPLGALINLSLLICTEGKQFLERLPNHPLYVYPMARSWVVEIALQLEEELFTLVCCLVRLSIASVVLLAV